MAGKKIKDQTVVRNRRVMIYTFLLILTLLYISGHSAAEKAKREAAGVETGAGIEAGETTAATMKDSEEDNGQAAGGETGESAEGAAEEETGAEGEIESAGPVILAETTEGTVKEIVKETAEPSLAISPDELWCLILTNAEYPVPEDYTVVLKDVPGTEQTVDERIYDPLMEMVEAMKAEGLSPIVCSGYRTLDKQEKLFNRKVQSFVRSGHSKQESYELARQTISIPGSGEHCLGLAVDFFTNKYHRLETGFENTPEGKWLRENSQDYGFILRYDRGKEDITGIQYEPWHFRYVGVKVARYLKEHDLSLEEFYIEESLYG